MKVKLNEQGLVPAIAQDSNTGNVLMLGYMNPGSIKRTVEGIQVWFYSRSQEDLWHKGEVSGNYLNLREAWLDCDGDTILLKVDPDGPTCHTGETSCFFHPLEGLPEGYEDTDRGPGVLGELYAIVQDRQREMPEGQLYRQAAPGRRKPHRPEGNRGSGRNRPRRSYGRHGKPALGDRRPHVSHPGVDGSIGRQAGTGLAGTAGPQGLEAGRQLLPGAVHHIVAIPVYSHLAEPGHPPVVPAPDNACASVNAQVNHSSGSRLAKAGRYFGWIAPLVVGQDADVGRYAQPVNPPVFAIPAIVKRRTAHHRSHDHCPRRGTAQHQPALQPIGQQPQQRRAA